MTSNDFQPPLSPSSIVTLGMKSDLADPPPSDIIYGSPLTSSIHPFYSKLFSTLYLCGRNVANVGKQTSEKSTLFFNVKIERYV